MKKKLLMAAVGAALVAGPMAAVHAGTTLYGHWHMSLDRFDNDDTLERGFISSNSNRFGIKGDEDLGGGLKAIYQMESGGFNADTGAGGLGGTLRNTFFGFAGGWGTVKVGRHDTPFKSIGRKLDNFNEQVGDMRNAIGSGVGIFNWDQRVSNMVLYESPKFAGGWTAAYQYATAEGGASGGDINSASLMWSAGPLMAALSYETHGTGTSDDETGIRLIGSYTMNDLTFGLFYEALSDLIGVSGTDLTTIGLVASYKMGNNKLKFHWVEVDDLEVSGGSLSGTGGSLIALGVDHSLSKSTKVYLNYAKADNDSNASFVNVASGNGGHGAALALSASGDKSPTGFSAGVILNF
jgi:predicted porin